MSAANLRLAQNKPKSNRYDLVFYYIPSCTRRKMNNNYKASFSSKHATDRPSKHSLALEQLEIIETHGTISRAWDKPPNNKIKINSFIYLPNPSG
jgi:hypothetical protein